MNSYYEQHLSVFANPFVDGSPSIQLRSIPWERKTENQWFKLHYLVSHFGDAPSGDASKDDKAIYQTKVDDTLFV
jgi:hypothetical protein